jgi:hypothetical protein
MSFLSPRLASINEVIRNSEQTAARDIAANFDIEFKLPSS